jgi:colanic acid biosynthesis glycosyl transferase WcaI
MRFRYGIEPYVAIPLAVEHPVTDRKYRIALLTPFYAPEPCAAARRAVTLVKALQREGHEVTVITNFTLFPHGRVDAKDRFRLVKIERQDGVRIARLLTLTFRGVPGARFFHWATSALAASVFAFATIRSFDIVVVTMPPITLALPAFLFACYHGAKIVVDSRDVYPDIAVAMGEWRKDSLLTRAVEFVARTLYRNAELVTAVTPVALREIGSRGVEPVRLFLAPNGCDVATSDIVTGEPGKDAQQFDAIYAGNLGLATDIDTLVETAVLLQNDTQIRLTIVGNGVEGERLRNRIAELGLPNLRLLDPVSRVEALQMMASADVALVSLRKGICESIPTKIYDALSIGCPVLVSAEGEARRITIESGGGVVVDPGNPPLLAQRLRELAAMDREELRAMGRHGRTFVETYYQRDPVMATYSRRIAQLWG